MDEVVDLCTDEIVDEFLLVCRIKSDGVAALLGQLLVAEHVAETLFTFLSVLGKLFANLVDASAHMSALESKNNSQKELTQPVFRKHFRRTHYCKGRLV